MKAIDVCAGAGGLSLGLLRAGYDVIGVERDTDSVATHVAHVGPCVHDDITAWHPIDCADLVAGGVPCQTWSASGSRAGFSDPRGELFLDLLRIAREARAEAVLLENVRGMVTWGQGSALETIKRAFLAHGYDPIHALLDASDYGVPQRRIRLFIVGFTNPAARTIFQWPAPTHGAPGNVLRLPAWRTVRQALGLGDGRYETGRIDGASGYQGQRRLNVDAPGLTVNGSRNGEPLDRPSPVVRANSSHEGRGTRPSQRPMTRLTDAMSVLDEPSRTVSAGGTGSGGGAEPFANVDYRAALAMALTESGVIDRPSTTVAGDPRLPVAGHHVRQQIGAVRLTVAQLAALQAFPSDFAFVGNKSSQHRQVGNAVPPPLAFAVGCAIRKAIERARTQVA